MRNKFLLPWVPLWVVVPLIAMAIGTVWLRLNIVRTTYGISQTDRMIHNLEQDLEQQELQVTGLRSPRRLETIARTKYGLEQPKPEQIIHMTSGHILPAGQVRTLARSTARAQ